MTRPSAWPVLAAYAMAFVAMLVAGQAIVSTVARHRAGDDPVRAANEAMRFALSLPGLSTVAAIDAVILLGIAWATARVTAPRAPAAEALALSAGRANALGWVAATVGVAGLSVACGSLSEIFGAGRGAVMPVVNAAVESSHGPGLALALGALAVLPGLSEELFFRGLLQTRLAAAWGVGPAIVAQAAAFGALHLDGVQAASAFVVGLYLGWIAARFGSIRPGIAAHLVNNAVFLLLSFAGASGADAATRRAYGPVAAGLSSAAAALVVLRSGRALKASKPVS